MAVRSKLASWQESKTSEGFPRLLAPNLLLLPHKAAGVSTRQHREGLSSSWTPTTPGP